ncbi:hypothetical protein B0T22DRAFT_300136 [Podospora appendiculata]|uniref:Secreted protein n=1 Tax=Podospora appendiculata TaxID=314037 RepID=A0AAE0X0F3_9PEZI|nr:hypothetical protein B0T22DRAFT_300136 [Podospora appendiculata]
MRAGPVLIIASIFSLHCTRMLMLPWTRRDGKEQSMDARVLNLQRQIRTRCLDMEQTRSQYYAVPGVSRKQNEAKNPISAPTHACRKIHDMIFKQASPPKPPPPPSSRSPASEESVCVFLSFL